MTVNRLYEILEEKGGDVFEIEGGASVFEAVQLMVEMNTGSLLVTEGGEITGIVTERDYLRRVTLEGRAERETAVREIMSSPLIVASPQTTVISAMHSSIDVCGVITISGEDMISRTEVPSSVRPSTATRRR